MLKKRVISAIVFNGKTITRGFDFTNNRPVGSLIQQVKIYNLREIDELIVYNISGRVLSKPNLENITKHCFMPLAIGGGIRSLQDIEYLLTYGADKVVLNTACGEDPTLLQKAVRVFGAQAITVGVDFRKIDGELYHYVSNGIVKTNRDVSDWCKYVEDLGAGEIIITSIDNDGRRNGFNIDDTAYLSRGISIPVVISGGAGSFDDFRVALEIEQIDAVCASSFYLFNRYTPGDVKKYLLEKNISVRNLYH